MTRDAVFLCALETDANARSRTVVIDLLLRKTSLFEMSPPCAERTNASKRAPSMPGSRQKNSAPYELVRLVVTTIFSQFSSSTGSAKKKEAQRLGNIWANSLLGT